jgi:hypothetical protein
VAAAVSTWNFAFDLALGIAFAIGLIVIVGK